MRFFFKSLSVLFFCLLMSLKHVRKKANEPTQCFVMSKEEEEKHDTGLLGCYYAECNSRLLLHPAENSLNVLNSGTECWGNSMTVFSPSVLHTLVCCPELTLSGALSSSLEKKTCCRNIFWKSNLWMNKMSYWLNLGRPLICLFMWHPLFISDHCVLSIQNIFFQILVENRNRHY